MRTFRLLTLVATIAALPASMVACGDDDSTGTGGSGAGTSNGGSGAGTSNGGGVPTDFETITGTLSDDLTLTADTNWMLEGNVIIPDGVTLTIEAGTTVYGDTNTKGTLVVRQGAQLIANGTADSPIVFTSPAPEPQAGDWGGVVILGRAPITVGGGETTASIEGFTTDEIYGGNDPADSSGSLQYVRIEFSGIEISPDNEINGLTMGGVGNGTTISHVMVRATLDDCFEWFGGTVDGDHLVCYRNGDDGFDMDEGYNGNLQFLFLQADPDIADSANGFESDSKTSVADDDTAHTQPTIYNVTLCGQNGDQAKQQYGMLLREKFAGKIFNAIITGYEAGIDIRDTPQVGLTNLDLTLENSIVFGNTVENIAYDETLAPTDDEGPTEDDDESFDEAMWFTMGPGNATDDPGVSGCFDAVPNPVPTNAAVVTTDAATPPAGFDQSATYKGAFDPAGDNWLTEGTWVKFD